MRITSDLKLILDKEEHEQVRRVAAALGEREEKVVADLYGPALTAANRERRFRRRLVEAGYSRTD